MIPPPIIRSANTKTNIDTVVCAPEDGWWYHPKHVQQFPDKINCVTLHLVGHILEYPSFLLTGYIHISFQPIKSEINKIYM